MPSNHNADRDPDTSNFGVTVALTSVAAILSVAVLSGTPMEAHAATIKSLVEGKFLVGKAPDAPKPDKATGKPKQKGSDQPPSTKTFSYVAVSSSWTSGLPTWCQKPAQPYLGLMNKAAKANNVDVRLLGTLTCYESGFRHDVCSRIKTPTGWLTDENAACGLTQIMPKTAEGLGVTNRKDPWQSLNGGAKYLREKANRWKRLDYILASYNAGDGAVSGYRNGVKVRPVGVPPFAETRDYVFKITKTFRDCGGKV